MMEHGFAASEIDTARQLSPTGRPARPEGFLVVNGLLPDRRLCRLAGARVLVTGGGGLVGSRIVRLLGTCGSEPVVLDRMDAYPHPVRGLFGLEEGVRVVLGDVREAATVRALARESDYVIHAAARADVAACTRRPAVAFANVHGTQTVLQEVLAAPSVKRLVFVSSASVYGDGPARAEGSREFAEDQPTHPISLYANSKLWGEHQVRLMLTGTPTEYTVLRYFSVYGEPQVPKPESHSWMVAWLAMCAYLGLPMRLNGGGRQVRDMVHVEDIANATVLALVADRAVGQTINVGSGIATSVRQIAKRIALHYPTAELVDTPLPQGDPLGGYAATGRSRDLLGWQPRIAVNDGIDRYVDWLRATPRVIPQWLSAEAAAV